MIQIWAAVVVASMAGVTNLCRVLGFWLLRNRTLSRRMSSAMAAAPGCVLLSVIAKDFVSPRPADLLALILTVLAATRLPMLVTVTIAIGSAAILRHFLP